MQNRDEYRAIDYPVTERAILEHAVAAVRRKPFDVISLPEFEPPLPSDARVLGVIYDWQTRLFYFRCEHPSFPLHEEGSYVRRAVEKRRVVERSEEAEATVIYAE